MSKELRFWAPKWQCELNADEFSIKEKNSISVMFVKYAMWTSINRVKFRFHMGQSIQEWTK